MICNSVQNYEANNVGSQFETIFMLRLFFMLDFFGIIDAAVVNFVEAIIAKQLVLVPLPTVIVCNFSGTRKFHTQSQIVKVF